MRPIRRLLRVAAGAIALAALSSIAWTQSNYPARSVRVIVPFAPGGSTDIFARVAAQKLSERLGKQFYVENIGGAGGNLGTFQAARAAPDGHTVLFAFGSFVLNPNVFVKVPYDPVRDFEPVTLAVTTPTALLVNPAVPAKTVAELVALIKANPGKYSYAHGGFGTQPHLTGEQFRLAFALDLAQVPYNGAGPSNASVVAGHTSIGFSSIAAAAPHINDGRLRPLAVTSKARSQVLPDVPTMAEVGLPNIVGDSWVGVLLPAGTPHDIVTLLHRELVEIIAQPDMKERLGTLGFEPVASAPQDFARLIKDELEAWGKVVRAADIKLQQ